MKKFVSIFLAVMMCAMVIAVNAVPAFAVWYGSIEDTDSDIVIKVTVDGIKSIKGTFDHLVNDKDNDYHVINFEYTGDKEIDHWEIKDLKENIDYKVLYEDETTIKIEIINPVVTDVWANAITTEAAQKGEESKTTTSKVEKPDNSLTSPKTGLPIFGAMSLAGGAMLLVTAKKRK